MHGLQMCVRKISGFVLLCALTCSSLLRSQIFYVYRPRAPESRYVPIVRRFELGGGLFTGLSLAVAVALMQKTATATKAVQSAPLTGEMCEAIKLTGVRSMYADNRTLSAWT